MSDIDYDYVVRSAHEKYTRDLKSCVFFGKVQPRKLAGKIIEINDRLGDGHGGLLGHNLDKVKSLEGVSADNLDLFHQCMVLALTVQSLCIYGRSQNFDIARYCQEVILQDRQALTTDTDPRRYIQFMDMHTDGRMKLYHGVLSERFLRHSKDIRYAIDGALYGILHPAFDYGFGNYLEDNPYHQSLRNTLETFFMEQARSAWEGRKGDIPVLITRGHIIDREP